MTELGPFLSDPYYQHLNSPTATGSIGVADYYDHSVRVSSLSAYNSQTGMYEPKFVSKWGSGGLYMHFASNSPYPGSYHYFQH